jgi:hypothetical protein
MRERLFSGRVGTFNMQAMEHNNIFFIGLIGQAGVFFSVPKIDFILYFFVSFWILFRDMTANGFWRVISSNHMQRINAVVVGTPLLNKT